MESVTTQPFVLRSSRYMRYVAESVAFRWCWIPVLLLAGCAVAAMYDTVWLFVGLIVAVAIPLMVLPVVVLTHAMMPEAIAAIHEHTVCVSEEGVSVNVHDCPVLTRRYAMRDIKMVRIARDHTIVIGLRTPRHHFVLIDPDALDDGGRRQVMAMMGSVDSNRGVDV